MGYDVRLDRSRMHAQLGLRAMAREGLLAVTILAASLVPIAKASAFSPLVQIKDGIPREKFDALKQKIPPLSDFPIEIVRYFEVNDGAVFVRVEDPRYCFDARCLTFVANSTLSSYVAIQAADKFFLMPQIVLLGNGATTSDGGTINAFLTASTGSSAPEIRVFVNDKLVVVLP